MRRGSRPGRADSFSALSSTPFFNLLYFPDSFSRAPLMWGDSEQTLNRTRFKPAEETLVCCAFFLPSLRHLPAECERGFVSNSLVHLHYHHQPHSPSLILSSYSFFFIVCPLLRSVFFCLFCCCLFSLSLLLFSRSVSFVCFVQSVFC